MDCAPGSARSDDGRGDAQAWCVHCAYARVPGRCQTRPGGASTSRRDRHGAPRGCSPGVRHGWRRPAARTECEGICRTGRRRHTVLEAIHSATIGAARAFALDSEIGTIAAGQIADIIAGTAIHFATFKRSREWCLSCFHQGAWGPTPKRSRSAASRLARAAGAQKAGSAFHCGDGVHHTRARTLDLNCRRRNGLDRRHR
jgi:hypothetical protein